ncbi:hypothetical protein [Nocardia flavorosea]|uniref:hypothetical protein n=1 Tax=Nocardia flavorosea TaxID=53429 RepID=UPI00245798E8|nr:hypothetical protein [Nocardia flavorosea]
MERLTLTTVGGVVLDAAVQASLLANGAGGDLEKLLWPLTVVAKLVRAEGMQYWHARSARFSDARVSHAMAPSRKAMSSEFDPELSWSSSGTAMHQGVNADWRCCCSSQP